MKLKKIHIIVIIIGAIIMLAGTFHTNIWFDESYTVGMVNQSFKDMIVSGIDDVHPLLYYILLKMYSLFVGTGIIQLRIFSCIGMIILSILGYTHIRKDLGEKAGLIFSLLVSFLPVTLLYANEIRMYSWVAVFVTLTGIYAFRVWKNNNKKDWILFAIFSLASAYSHYYGMMTIGIINIILMVIVLKNREKYLKNWIKTAIGEIVFFIPGLIIFIKQAFLKTGGFWITVKYPDILKDIITFNYTGVLDSKLFNIIIFTFASIFSIYWIYKLIKQRKSEDSKLPVYATLVYIISIAIPLIISIKLDMFVTRYTIPMLGLLLIGIAYILSKETNKIILTIVTMCIAILSISNIYIFYSQIYDSQNNELNNVLSEYISEEDIFICKDITLAGVIAEKYPNNKSYFYNIDHWDIKNAYNAFLPQMEVIEDLSLIENYEGKIWLIDSGDEGLYNLFSEDVRMEEIIVKRKVHQPYKNLNFIVTLMDKNN